MTGKPMWMVRAASGGRLADEFKEKGIVAIGWEDVGDLSKYSGKAEIHEAVKHAWPDSSEGQWQSSASQLIRFRDQLDEGDRVITYDSSRRIYLVGTIIGPYKHLPDVLSSATRNRLGSTLTLFLVPEFSAEEIEACCNMVKSTGEFYAERFCHGVGI